MLQPHLTLAADVVGTAITVAFVVITFIGWIINLVNSQAKPPAPNRGNRPARPRSERVQAEIEQFMREQAKNLQRSDETAPRPAEARKVEPKKPAPRRTAQPQNRPPKPVAKSPRPPLRAPAPPLETRPAQEPRLPRPGEGITERQSVGSKDLGQRVREHVHSTMQERVQSSASRYLTVGDVNSSVSQHLGTFSAERKQDSATSQLLAADRILELLRTREGVRQAFILNEILQRPKFGRRPR